MARITSGGPGGAPVRLLDDDIQSKSLEELKEYLAFLRGNRSMIPASSKGGRRTASVKKDKPEIEEESI